MNVMSTWFREVFGKGTSTKDDVRDVHVLYILVHYRETVLIYIVMLLGVASVYALQSHDVTGFMIKAAR